MVHWPFRSRMPSAAFIVALMLAEVVFQGHARVVDLVNDAGLVAEDDSFDTATANTVILNNTLYNTTGLSPLTPGDTVVIPNTTIHFIGGIRIYHLTNVTMIIDGTMHFGSDAWDLPHVWPTDSSGEIEDCIRIENVLDFTITSSLGTHESNAGYKGVLDGWGHRWWGVPGIGYLVHGERVRANADTTVRCSLLRPPSSLPPATTAPLPTLPTLPPPIPPLPTPTRNTNTNINTPATTVQNLTISAAQADPNEKLQQQRGRAYSAQEQPLLDSEYAKIRPRHHPLH
mmetsp:Transcript_97109/g.277884  ORF Transcript_97109/g.277884 Transcript_97109/m.277884 type:complete len:286 (+) Transcript_97109:303-1160(+)